MIVNTTTTLAAHSDEDVAALFVERGSRLPREQGTRFADGLASGDHQRLAITIVEMLAALGCEALLTINGVVVTAAALAPEDFWSHLEVASISDDARADIESGDPVRVIAGLRAMTLATNIDIAIHPVRDDEPIDPTAADTVPIGTNDDEVGA